MRLRLAHEEEGKSAIGLDEFRAILRECISTSSVAGGSAAYTHEEAEQIEALFMKIDSESTDKITIVSQNFDFHGLKELIV